MGRVHICGIERRGHRSRVFVVKIAELFPGIVSVSRNSTNTRKQEILKSETFDLDTLKANIKRRSEGLTIEKEILHKGVLMMDPKRTLLRFQKEFDFECDVNLIE